MDILEPKAAFIILDWQQGVMAINKILEAHLNAGKPWTKMIVLVNTEDDNGWLRWL